MPVNGAQLAKVVYPLLVKIAQLSAERSGVLPQLCPNQKRINKIKKKFLASILFESRYSLIIFFTLPLTKSYSIPQTITTITAENFFSLPGLVVLKK